MCVSPIFIYLSKMNHHKIFSHICLLQLSGLKKQKRPSKSRNRHQEKERKAMQREEKTRPHKDKRAEAMSDNFLFSLFFVPPLRLSRACLHLISFLPSFLCSPLLFLFFSVSPFLFSFSLTSISICLTTACGFLLSLVSVPLSFSQMVSLSLFVACSSVLLFSSFFFVSLLSHFSLFASFFLAPSIFYLCASLLLSEVSLSLFNAFLCVFRFCSHLSSSSCPLLFSLILSDIFLCDFLSLRVS